MTGQQEKLRVAVAGTSFAAVVQIPVLQTHPRTRVVAVSSGRPERAAQTARELEIPSHYVSFDEMLDRERPHAVVIASPPHLHDSMARGAIERGIHVICEKPFALNAAEAEGMARAAEGTTVVAMVDFEFRFLPARQLLTRLLREGRLGEVRVAEFHYRRGFRSRADDAPWDWWSDESRGGGMLGALASHAVDSMRLWFGEVSRVFCDLSIYVKERSGQAVTADDTFSLLLDFHSGVRAVSQMSGVCGSNDTRIGVYGVEGQLVIPNAGTELWLASRGAAPERLEMPPEFVQADEGHPLRAPFRVLLNRFVAAIDNGERSPSPDFTDGLSSQRILDAARASARRGAWISLQPWQLVSSACLPQGPAAHTMPPNFGSTSANLGGS